MIDIIQDQDEIDRQNTIRMTRLANEYEQRVESDNIPKGVLREL